MDNPNSPNQLVLSDASSTNLEDQPSTYQPEAPELPMEGPNPPNAEQEREYGCRYCTKKFTNIQALGGHYNGHKHERAVEKTARESVINGSGYYGAGGVAYPGPYLGPYHRSHDFVGRSVYNNFPYNEHQEQRGTHIGYNAHPELPLAGNPYAQAQPVPGFNNAYPGWAAPSQFPGQSTYNAQNGGANIRYPNIDMGDASTSSRPVYPDLSVFAAPGNEMNDQQDEDESGLDLSLKL